MHSELSSVFALPYFLCRKRRAEREATVLFIATF